MGIITKGWADEAKALGKNFDAQFILNKIKKDSAPLMKRLGELQETNAEKQQRMVSSADNLALAIGQKLEPAISSAAGAFADLMEEMTKFISSGQAGKTWDAVYDSSIVGQFHQAASNLYNFIYEEEIKIAKLKEQISCLTEYRRDPRSGSTDTMSKNIEKLKKAVTYNENIVSLATTVIEEATKIKTKI